MNSGELVEKITREIRDNVYIRRVSFYVKPLRNRQKSLKTASTPFRKSRFVANVDISADLQ